MHHSILLFFSSAIGLAIASPLEPRTVPKFTPGTAWDIVLDKSKTNLAALKAAPGKVIDIDLLDITEANDQTTIKELAKTKQVICYFSAGSREDWREDAAQFGSSDYGQELDGWPGENWVNVKSDNVRSIMKARIEKAKQAGCTAVDPDNVDGYDGNQDGFGYPRSAYADYVKYMAKVAHDNDMAIGLKNAVDMIPDVLSDVQFAVNEECRELNECNAYKSMTKAGLAVFNIEYATTDCSDPSGVNLSTVLKTYDLDTIGGQC